MKHKYENNSFLSILKKECVLHDDLYAWILLVTSMMGPKGILAPRRWCHKRAPPCSKSFQQPQTDATPLRVNKYASLWEKIQKSAGSKFYPESPIVLSLSSEKYSPQMLGEYSTQTSPNM